MDTSIMLTIAGLVIGVVGTLYTIRARNVLRIIFLQISVIPLFDSIVKNFNTISITHKGIAIDEGLIHFRGSVINSGNKDIDKSMMYSPLTVMLPDKHQWLEITIEGNSSATNTAYEIIAPNVLAFRWDLLKAGEHITFNALIAAPEAKPFLSKSTLRFSHRVSNVPKVHFLRTIDSKDKMPGFLPIISTALLIVFTYFSYPFQQFEITDTILLNAKRVPVTVSYSADNIRHVVSRDSSFQKELHLDELVKGYGWHQVDKWYTGLDLGAIALVSLGWVGSLGAWALYIKQYKVKRLLTRIEL